MTGSALQHGMQLPAADGSASGCASAGCGERGRPGSTWGFPKPALREAGRGQSSLGPNEIKVKPKGFSEPRLQPLHRQRWECWQ